jgi:Ty3 transposon capsid-like protein
MPRSTMNSQATDLDIDRATLIQNVRQGPPEPPESPSPPHQEIDDDLLSNPLHDQSTPSLAQAIMLMTAELRRRDSPSKSTSSKVKEPDTFDGSDPKKLNNFILLCNLYFRNNSAYSDDNAKITFALSHLRGTALEFFEPMLMSDDQLTWEDDWPEFIRILRTQFGPIDPTADAEDNIDNLKMKENQRILEYNVEFNGLAVQTGWNDSVLRHRYYSGLAERIKDAMGQLGKPSTLDKMKTLAHSVDARYWERIREKSCSGSDKTSNTNSSNNNFKSDKPNSNSDTSDTSDHTSPNNNSNNKNQSNGSSTSNSSDNKNLKNNKSESSANPLSDKLGKDGKLTPQERQRRFDNDLCMFCGATGHTADNCPKSTSAASKANRSL